MLVQERVSTSSHRLLRLHIDEARLILVGVVVCFSTCLVLISLASVERFALVEAEVLLDQVWDLRDCQLLRMFTAARKLGTSNRFGGLEGSLHWRGEDVRDLHLGRCEVSAKSADLVNAMVRKC